jgi:hypothetical protein
MSARCERYSGASRHETSRTPAHPYQTSVDIASLAPNAEVTVYPWRDPPELKERTINRVRTFLEAHQPVTASR